MSVSELPQVIFNVTCPVLKRRVILKKDTWKYKICSHAVGHPIMRGKEDLVRGIIESSIDPKTLLWQSIKPKNKPFIQVPVPDFLKRNKYLRIGLEIVSDEIAVITTAFPVDSYPKGAMQYECHS